MLDSLQTIEMIEKYAANNYGKMPPVVPEIGYGPWILDKNGKKYLDCSSSYSVLSFGHKHPRLVQALKNQLDMMPICSRMLPTESFAKFSRDLANFCKMGKVLPAVDGAGAIDKAIKIVRKWGYQNKGFDEGKGNYPRIVSLVKNFHGRSYGALSLSDNESYKKGFGPFLPGTHALDPDVFDLECFFDWQHQYLAAILIEPIQGEGGVIIPPDGFLKKVRQLCNEHNVLMVADEIQTGMGRTGYDLACQYEDVKPDIYLLGKALGGGLVPVSAVVTTDEIMSVLGEGDDGNTFGGYPLGCDMACESLKVLKDEKLSENARIVGAYFLNQLQTIKSDCVKDVRGRGLMIGIEIENEALAHQLHLSLMEAGVICGLSRHNVLRFSPPLIITKDTVDWALPRIEKVLREAG